MTALICAGIWLYKHSSNSYRARFSMLVPVSHVLQGVTNGRAVYTVR